MVLGQPIPKTERGFRTPAPSCSPDLFAPVGQPRGHPGNTPPVGQPRLYLGRVFVFHAERITFYWKLQRQQIPTTTTTTDKRSRK
jgi:hypothetical protein